MRPMSAEFTARPGALTKRFLGALGFVAFGLFATLDASSALVTRAFGIVVALAAGLFAWLYVREALRPGTRLILDPSGLHLRRRPPETDFDGSWTELDAVRVDRTFDPPRVVATFVHGSPAPGGERSANGATEIHLPEIIGHLPDDLAAEIERFRRAYVRLLTP